MINKGMRVRLLKGDSEKSFVSKEARRYYQQNNITFVSVVTKGSQQTSLAIVDRLIRTLRDMAHKIDPKIKQIYPPLMNRLLINYNQVPHDGLPKIIGFNVSPINLEQDGELDALLIKNVVSDNESIQHTPGFNIKIGSIVKLFNPKETLIKRRSVVRDELYRVTERIGARYHVRGLESNEEIIVPRFALQQV